MSTKKKQISIVTLIALIGIIVVGLGILAFSQKTPFHQEPSLNADSPQQLRGIITQVELGKDGLQIELQTEYLLYNVTISKLQTEIIGSFDQIEAGTEIEVSGQEIAGTNPPLIVADYVSVLGSFADLTGETWILTTYNGKQPFAGYEPSIQFIDGQISGKTGCNHYGGSYQINGDIIKFDGIYSTEMACMEPEGIMEQERIYLELILTADRFELVDEALALFAGTNQILTFEKEVVQTISTDPTFEDPNITITSELVEPTLLPAIVVPASFREYQDSITGISIYIPEDWYIQNDSIIQGDYAIFSSYPPDKYTGGEARQPGDTKCDLNLNPDVDSIDSLVHQWESSPMTTIVSEEEIVLNSGNPGIVFVIDSMGRSTKLVTKINGSLVLFTCWGDFELFYEIAVTLRASTEGSP